MSREQFIQDIQEVLAKHNVSHIDVKEGRLFNVEDDGSLTIGADASIKRFQTEPDKPLKRKFGVVKGGKEE